MEVASMAVIGITNIGCMVSGEINNPLIKANTLVIKDKLFAEIGDESILDRYTLDTKLDAGGMTVIPGLIDSHIHVVLGDFTPRQNSLGFIEKCLNGGVTTMISAGESHAPGRPKDVAGTKALAVLAHKSFANLRPAGVKVHGGALILEHGLKEDDFKELAEAGVWLVGEIGLGGVKDPDEAAEMVRWAKKYGFKTMLHTGGTSVPGSASITADDVLKICPDVVSHINGGPTAVPVPEIERIIASETDFAYEMVQCGNFKALQAAMAKIKVLNKLDKVILGNDCPSGSGVVTLGILRSICFIACFCDIAPEVAVAMATGNTAKVYNLNVGIIAPGKEADLVILDNPPGSAARSALEALALGDIPGIAHVLVDGEIKINKSSITPPPNKKSEVIKLK